MNEYTKTSKLPKGAFWRHVGSYYYKDALNKSAIIVEHQKAFIPAAIGGAVGNRDPVINPKTGKQLKQCPQNYLGFPEGRKPKHWQEIPYRLPELIEAVKAGRTIHIAEGEAKVDALREWGLDATCNIGGAGNWKPELAYLFRWADVVILPDNDEPGRKHSDKVGRSLEGFTKSLRLLELPGLPEHGDIIDWKAAGGTKQQLLELLEGAREWTAYGPPPLEGTRIEAIEIQPGEIELYKVTIEGAKVTVDAEALNNEHRFNRAAIAQARRSFALIKPAAWSAMVDEALREAKEPEPTEDETLRFHGTDSWGKKEIEWTVRERVPQRGVGLLSGSFSMFKSFTLLDLSGSIITGLPWLQARVTRRGGVLIFAAEGSNSIPMRLAALIEHKLAQHERKDLFRDGLDLNQLPFSCLGKCRSLILPSTVDWMVEKAAIAQEYFQSQFGVELALIGIDTISAAAGWESENDAAQVQMVMNHMNAVSRATGAFVLAVDHFGKDVTAGTRGSIVKEATADVILAVLGERKEEGTVKDTRLVLRKVREGPQGLEFPFDAKIVDMGQDQYNEPLTSRVIDWNVERQKPEPKKQKPLGQKILEDILSATLWEVIQANGSEGMRAVRKETVHSAFKETYQRAKPSANPDAVGEAWRQALRVAGIEHNAEYLWYPESPI
jgi:hypothetical protein